MTPCMGNIFIPYKKQHFKLSYTKKMTKKYVKLKVYHHYKVRVIKDKNLTIDKIWLGINMPYLSKFYSVWVEILYGCSLGNFLLGKICVESFRAENDKNITKWEIKGVKSRVPLQMYKLKCKQLKIVYSWGKHLNFLEI